ncbi:MAG: hypothetical protein IJX98_03260 [Clostridia bacterium]|nr:hypothetical protein [Clostridia bacterium]
MTEIKVTDRESFEDVCFLIREGLAPKGVTLDGYDIVTGNERFVLVDAGKEHRDAEDREGGFHRFDALYSAEHAVGQTWETMLSDVLNYFYEKHSYLVYDPIETDENEDKADCVRKAISKIYGEKLDGKYTVEERNDEQTEGESYIYEVAIKFKLELGGIPMPVINKFYLDKNFRALSPASCKRVYERLLHEKQDDTAEKEVNRSAVNMDQGTMQNITSAIEELVYNEEDGFHSYLVGSAREQFEEFLEEQRLINQRSVDGEIFARDFKIRYVAYIKTQAKNYVVRDLKGNALFYAERGNSDVSLTCAYCEEELIDGNVITIGEEGAQKTFVLDLSDKINLGLTEQDWREIEEDKKMASHCAQQSCQWKGGECKRFYCESKMQQCSECNRSFCFDCTHDEVIRRRIGQDGTEEIIHIPCAHFVVDTLDYEPKANVFTCFSCQRSFIKDFRNPNRTLCEVCAKVETPTTADRDACRDLYLMHKNLLPLQMRDKENLCEEDAQKIVFGIYKKGQFKFRYIIDKNECRIAMEKGKLIGGRVQK